MKNITPSSCLKSLLCGAAIVAALFASAHCASAVEVDVDLNCGFTSVSDPSGISVSTVGEYDCWADTYLAENGGGTITLQIDLPCGTFDISATAGPNVAGAQGTPDINGGNSTGIIGPTTVYVSFLNAGAVITTASAISISGDLADTSPTEVDVDLDCGFTSVSDPSGIIVTAVGEEYDCWADTYLAENGGGTITVEVDLPCGTFDISATAGPNVGGAQGTPDINGGNPTGIVGPTTVYVSFLNAGAAITTASSISINRY